MAVTFLDAGSDETFDLTFWPNVSTDNGGAFAVATDQAHTGTHSLKASTAGGIGDDVFVGSADGACSDAGTVCSFWMRMNITPTTNQVFWTTWQAGFGSAPLALALTTSGKIQLIRDDGTAAVGADGSTTIAAATWTRICLAYVITSGTNWTAKVYINGVLEMTRTNADATLANTGTSEIGPTIDRALTGGTRSAWTVWYDDIYVNNRTDFADPGDVLVTAKRPVSNGTTNGFTTQIGAGGSGYGSGHAPQVNERPLSQTNGWSILVVASAITEEYTIEGLSVGDVDLTGATLKGVMGWIVAKSSITESDQIIVDGGLTTITATSTPTLFTALSPNQSAYPGTGTDIGMKTNTTAATASLYECGVLIAYLAASGGGAPVGRAVETIQSRNRASTF